MNRADRRKEKKAKPGYMKISPEQRKRNMEKHGITEQDLAREYIRGWEAGRDNTASFFMRTVYAAMALAMKRELGFGRERTLRVIYAADKIIVEELTTDTIVRRVSRECGIDLYFKKKEEEGELFEIID